MLKVSFSDGERNISNVEFHGVIGLPAAEPFPSTGFQITIEEGLT
jgi:hypothetical protein